MTAQRHRNARPAQDVRRFRGRRRHRSAGAARQLLRIPRPERRRQVHHHQVPDRPAAADRRHVPDSRHGSAADPVKVKRQVGVVPEDLALFDRLTGAETLSFVGQVHGIDRIEVRERSKELLDADGPDEVRERSGRRLLARHAQEDRAVGRAAAGAASAVPRRAVRRHRRDRVAADQGPADRVRARAAARCFSRRTSSRSSSGSATTSASSTRAGSSRRDRWPSCAPAASPASRSKSASWTSSARAKSAALGPRLAGGMIATLRGLRALMWLRWRLLKNSLDRRPQARLDRADVARARARRAAADHRAVDRHVPRGQRRRVRRRPHDGRRRRSRPGRGLLVVRLLARPHGVHDRVAVGGVADAEHAVALHASAAAAHSSRACCIWSKSPSSLGDPWIAVVGGGSDDVCDRAVRRAAGRASRWRRLSPPC